MIHRKSIIIAGAAIICMIGACGRRADKPVSSSRRNYRAIVSDATRLYTRLHPLRSSQLELYGADSVLFTFSPDEIEDANGEIEQLLDAASRIKPAHLDEAAVANLTFIILWLEGERFTFEDLAPHRRNPLLYCWIVEEALFGIPSREQPPYAGERESYETRIARIPLLLSNAERFLENPAEPNLTLAQKRIAGLRAAIGELETLLTGRYGGSIAALEPARRSLDGFSRFLDDDLSGRAHGSILIGSENLSRIFLYDECLTIDASWIEREGSQLIERLRQRASSARRRIEAIQLSPSPIEPQQSGLDSVLLGWYQGERPFGAQGPNSRGTAAPTLLRHIEALEHAAAGMGGFGERPAAPPLVVRDAGGIRRSSLPTNPYLTPPIPRTVLVSAIPPSPFAGQPCREYIVHRPSNGAMDIDDYTYALLGVLYPVRTGERLPCIAADTVRTILSSETYRNGWNHMILEDLIDGFRMHRSELELRLIEEDILAIARTQVVLRLHSGTFTSSSAIDYLAQTVPGLTVDEARAEYILASVSPSIAYRGIALLITEDMLKQGTLSRGNDPPRRRLRELMRRHAGLPLSLIRETLDE